MTANHITAVTSAGCARGISFLGALRTVRAHGEYNYGIKHAYNTDYRDLFYVTC